MSTTLTISRDSGWADRLRDYRVLVDGIGVAGIGNGETKSIGVRPGKHVPSMEIDWCRSNAVTFEISEDQTSDSCADSACAVPALCLPFITFCSLAMTTCGSKPSSTRFHLNIARRKL